MVEAGDELASLYSPDLVVTVQNLIDARKSGNAKNRGERRKSDWSCWASTTTQIQELPAATSPRRDLTIRSPISGHVIKKYVREGQYVEQGTPLYDVADLSTVWIQAQVYEDDMEFLPLDQQHPGRPATSRLDRRHGHDPGLSQRGVSRQAGLRLSARRSEHADRDDPLRAQEPRAQAAARLDGHRHLDRGCPRTWPRWSRPIASDPEQSEMLATRASAGGARERRDRHRQPDASSIERPCRARSRGCASSSVRGWPGPTARRSIRCSTVCCAATDRRDRVRSWSTPKRG